VLLPWPDHARARARRLDALRPQRADAAISGRDADGDDGVAGAVPGWFPDCAHVPARTRRPLGLPVDDAIGPAEAVIGTGLPAHVTQDGADQVNLRAVTVHEVVGGHVARSDDVLPRPQGARGLTRPWARRCASSGAPTNASAPAVIRRPRNSARTAAAQPGAAGRGQPPAEELCPTQAVAHRVGGLPVGAAFGARHDGHQGDGGGRFGRLTIRGEARSERRIAVAGAVGLAPAQVGLACGESGAGDTGGLRAPARCGRWAPARCGRWAQRQRDPPPWTQRYSWHPNKRCGPHTAARSPPSQMARSLQASPLASGLAP